MTVTGPVPAADLGLTLPHEHVFFDLGNWQLPAPAHKQWLADATVRADTFAEVYRDPMVCRDNLVFADETVAAQELRWFREAGGGTVVDVSLASIGRDPAALRRLILDGLGNLVLEVRIGVDDVPAHAHPALLNALRQAAL